MTSGPPPSGMCTSTSTTSGVVARIRSTAANHIARLADDLYLLSTAALAVDLVTDTGTKQLMVVNDEQAQRGRT